MRSRIRDLRTFTSVHLTLVILMMVLVFYSRDIEAQISFEREGTVFTGESSSVTKYVGSSNELDAPLGITAMEYWTFPDATKFKMAEACHAYNWDEFGVIAVFQHDRYPGMLWDDVWYLRIEGDSLSPMRGVPVIERFDD